MKNITVLVILFIVITMASCSKDDTPTGFDGSVRSIEDFFGKRALDSINKLGIALNTGNTPPDIKGSYLISPLILKKSLIPRDRIGQRFGDLKATFENQNNANLTVDYKEKQGISSATGKDSYISGSGNKFSVLLKTDISFNNKTLKAGVIISGEMSANGITNYHYILIMLDNKGDSTAIKNFEARLIYDRDGNSPKNNGTIRNEQKSNNDLKSSIENLNKF